MSAEDSELLAAIEAIRRLDPALTPLDGVILAAVTLGIADDTRSLAKLFEVEHALVIRAVNQLADGGVWLDVVERQARTQRTKVALSEAGRARLGAEEQCEAASGRLAS
ncbi:hypothetical protein GCM10007874_65460 [Labrys miyagiensis]|uniref:MarR family transcriptional regulator n=1 Tax=Labrys miyagiensis TaxID=346912 RepID=A0ABQ6CTR9_9HYPH|nr:hypothetical protein [Labrys miyagiensis]GLS23525.1 hypothetical protein GCM10007874_65460 [Labrys miyagiensis]